MTFINKITKLFPILIFGLVFISCGGNEAASAEKAPTTIEINTPVPEPEAAEKGGILKPVKWNFESKALGNDEFELTMIANIDKGWSIYSQHTSDDGPVPTSFEFESENFEAVGEVAEVGEKKEGHDPLFDVNVIKFTKGPVVFTQKVKVTDYSKPVSGYLTYMTCDDKRCLPPTDVDFEFALTK